MRPWTQASRAAIAAAVGLLVGRRLWRVMLDWGASTEEARRSLPGDALLAQPFARPYPPLEDVGANRVGDQMGELPVGGLAVSQRAHDAPFARALQ